MAEIQRVKDSIPSHLRQYIVDQPADAYTAEDQAVWRYTLRQLKNYLSTHAHQCYLEGLEKTGITVNEIPSIDNMCLRLKEFGWAAVPVSGFIPPAAFMEMQSLGILPIASAMRSIEHLLYTPAPDIVHEAAGHAPILVDPQFADYLKSYAHIAKNALIAKHDLEQYDAIRELSDLKEHPDSTEEQIAQAEARLDKINSEMTFVSEAALLGRMNWWTAEYGLIGDLENPKIYGAGLLSSIDESLNCLGDTVKKIPLSVDCVSTSYDITEQQPQLFVAKSFEDLPKVLDQLAQKLSFRRGGSYAMEKALEAETTNTMVIDSGLQVSGLVSQLHKSAADEVVYYNFSGPTQLCLDNKQIDNHGPAYHAQGFGSPIGLLADWSKPLSLATADELTTLGLVDDQSCRLQFASGVTVEGRFSGKTSHQGQWVLFRFEDCTVTLNDVTLFSPDWGVYDMAVGATVTSVFSGPADREAYGLTENFVKKVVPQKKISLDKQKLNQVYSEIRKMRKNNEIDMTRIHQLVDQMQSDHPDQWLPRLEIVELLQRGWAQDTELQRRLLRELEQIQKKHPSTQRVIDDGLTIADKIFQ